MRTIAEPKEYIDKLWGKQGIHKDETYRLMRYVLQVYHDNKVLLQNVVTGRLVVLDREEAEALGSLPAVYSPVMEHLVAEHYLVPENYDEHQQVNDLRIVLRRLEDVQRGPGITTYTILTTTACNARCYYCYEQGSRITTMTEQTADDVVNFIKNRCNPQKKVFLTWFGGEPTLTADRIAQICSGLQLEGIQYQSELITNGYLLDERMVSEAKSLWNLIFVQICVDGIECNYNNIKAYVGVADNPYQHVMRNVQLLLDVNINVQLRMNFDIGNYQDFEPFIEEVKKRFRSNSLLRVSAHPIIGSYPDRSGKILHGSDEWFRNAMIEIDRITDNAGMIHRIEELPSLHYRKCMAASDYAVTITPEGYLVRCPEQFDDKQIIGTVKEGYTNEALIQSWKQVTEHGRCVHCVLFPECVTMKNCLTSGLCITDGKRKKEISSMVIKCFQSQSHK